MTKNILIIGGTGIVGKAMVQLAVKKDYQVTVLTNDKNISTCKGVKYLVVDKNSLNYEALIEDLPDFDFVYDIIEYSLADAKRTFRLFKQKTSHIILLSTTLVYDREKDSKKPIPETNGTISPGEYGGYVDSKLQLESFWMSQQEVNFTILRTYHILGSGSLVGNFPHHNRDPIIVERIQRDETLTLFNGGNMPFNFIHPRDLAEIACRVGNNSKCYNQIYNALNPKVYKAEDYFIRLGKLLNKKITVKSVDYDHAYGHGWEMTLLPHCYDMSKLQQDLDFVPSISLDTGLRDALKSYPVVETDTRKIPVFRAMNKGATPKIIPWLRSASLLTNEQNKRDEVCDRA